MHEMTARLATVSFLLAAIVAQAKRLVNKRVRIDVSHDALAQGRLCEDRVWRQIVTILDAEARGCDLFDLEELREEYDADIQRRIQRLSDEQVKELGMDFQTRLRVAALRRRLKTLEDEQEELESELNGRAGGQVVGAGLPRETLPVRPTNSSLIYVSCLVDLWTGLDGWS